MIKPDYKNNSVVNLAASIMEAFGEKSLYPPLEELKGLKNAENVILLVIDGLGYEYLEKHGRNSALKKHLIKKLTSVFPSTTAAAATSLQTGVAPQQHGITGWFMFLKELGVVSAILPFKPRYGGMSFPNDGAQRSDIFTEKNIGDKISAPSFVIYPDLIMDGKVNKEERNVLAYKTLDEMFSQIKKAVNSSRGRKYIYSYWCEFDTICHREGCFGEKAEKCFRKLDEKLSSFIEALKGAGCALIITADHGLIDTPESKTIWVEDHPKLSESLALPLCGEPRTAFCYVHPSKSRQFEDYVKSKLSYCCDLRKSEDLIKENFFGLFERHSALLDRIGDYVIIMKDDYTVKDRLLKEKKYIFSANHGGVSGEEMYVPLALVKSF